MTPTGVSILIDRPSRPTSERGGCDDCEHFHGEWLARGAHALCRHGTRPIVQAQPALGCAFHLHAPGADG